MGEENNDAAKFALERKLMTNQRLIVKKEMGSKPGIQKVN